MELIMELRFGVMMADLEVSLLQLMSWDISKKLEQKIIISCNFIAI
jgi:hypothetical protein